MSSRSRTTPLLAVDAEDRDGSEDENRPTSDKSAQLGLYAVTAIIFFNVSGGPLGCEQAVAYCGPVVALSMLLVFAIAYSVPQAMITAEV